MTVAGRANELGILQFEGKGEDHLPCRTEGERFLQGEAADALVKYSWELLLTRS
jgi:hypothetical protein